MKRINLGDVTLPCCDNTERSVLGIMIRNPKTVEDFYGVLEPEHFCLSIHAELYKIIVILFANGTAINPKGIIDNSLKKGIFASNDEAASCISALCASTMKKSKIKDYINEIKEAYFYRALLELSRDIVYGVNGNLGSDEILNHAEEKFLELKKIEKIGGAVPLNSCMCKLVKDLADTHEEGYGIYAPAPQPANITTVTGQTEGEIFKKIINVIECVGGKSPDKKTVIFSLNMRRETFTAGLIEAASSIELNSSQNNILKRAEWVKISEIIEKLCNKRIYIDDTRDISVYEMRASLMEIKDLGLVIVNCCPAAVMQKQDDRYCSFNLACGNRYLNIMAADLNVPVVLCFPNWCRDMLMR